MKDFKGTQGNWEVDPYMDTLVRSTDSNGTVAECHDGTHWGNDEDVKRANAQLIAAAPDLLKALQTVIRLEDLILMPYPVDEVTEEYEAEYIAIYNLITQVEMAINKALGE